MADYDIITIGGGLGGASLARSMASSGARVLVLERETKFKDRVRGEGLSPWGCAEARELGIYDLLVSACGHPLNLWDTYVGEALVAHRDLIATTPYALPILAFYHPAMQQTLLEAAAAAGAEVRDGVRATASAPGNPPTVTIQRNGGPAETVSARLVIGADGRNSPVRKWGGFTESHDADRLFVTGALVEGCSLPEDTARDVMDFEHARGAIVFPQREGRARTYLISRVDEGMRLQGDRDLPRMIDALVEAGVPREMYEQAECAGPLATFAGADSYVGHPYRDGIALIGDAAASSDPSWGQGLALTVRDVRVLRDALLADDDWDAAAHAYAAEHDRYYGVLHAVEDWFTDLFYRVGPEGDAARDKAFGAMETDPSRQPDTFVTGPDHLAGVTECRRFFGDD